MPYNACPVIVCQSYLTLELDISSPVGHSMLQSRAVCPSSPVNCSKFHGTSSWEAVLPSPNSHSPMFKRHGCLCGRFVSLALAPSWEVFFFFSFFLLSSFFFQLPPLSVTVSFWKRDFWENGRFRPLGLPNMFQGGNGKAMLCSMSPSWWSGIDNELSSLYKHVFEG